VRSSIEKQTRMFSLVEDYLKREVTQAAFCDFHKISVSTLGYWVVRYNKEKGLRSEPTVFRKIVSETNDYSSITVFLPNGIKVSGNTASVITASRELIHLAS